MAPDPAHHDFASECSTEYSGALPRHGRPLTIVADPESGPAQPTLKSTPLMPWTGADKKDDDRELQYAKMDRNDRKPAVP